MCDPRIEANLCKRVEELEIARVALTSQVEDLKK